MDEAIAAENKAKEDDRKEDGIDTGTYQSRLLKAGMSRDETIAQCKNIIFAGTDPTGMNLCTIWFHLVRNPEKYVLNIRNGTVLLTTDHIDMNSSAASSLITQPPIYKAYRTFPQ